MTFSGKSWPSSISRSFDGREVLLRVLPERRQDLVEHLGVESRHGAPCVVSDAPRSLESGGGTTASLKGSERNGASESYRNDTLD